MLKIKNNFRGRKGVSLMEIVVSTGLGSALLFGLHMGVQQFRNMGTKYSMIGQRTDRLEEAYTNIMKMGRISGDGSDATLPACQRVNANLLRCFADLNVPPTGATSTIEFEKQGTNLIFRSNRSGNMQTIDTYDNITDFQICDDATMTAGNCTIQPIQMSTDHANNLLPAAGIKTLDNHFFRFSLTWTPPVGAGVSSQVWATSLQGAFFARNPTPVNKVVYQAFQKAS